MPETPGRLRLGKPAAKRGNAPLRRMLMSSIGPVSGANTYAVNTPPPAPQAPPKQVGGDSDGDNDASGTPSGGHVLNKLA
jgi:hypothetical protein